MTIDNIDIFQRYLEVLEEGNYVLGRVKREAGVGGKTGLVSPKEIELRADESKKDKLKADAESKKIYNVAELLGDLYKGGKEVAYKKLAQYVPYKEGKNFLNENDLINYLNKKDLIKLGFDKSFDKSSEQYIIPAFNLADKIENTKSQINTTKDGDQRDFFIKVYSVLSKLYEDNFGKKAEDIGLSDFKGARSFKTTEVKEGEGTRLARARVGGESKLNPKGEYVPITTREESPRLRREEEGGGKSFGSDIRGDIKNKPTAEQIRQDQLKRDRKEDFIYVQRLQNQGLSGEPLQDALRKYRADRAARRSGESTQPTKPTTTKPKSKKKPKITKESYEPFIKIIPF